MIEYALLMGLDLNVFWDMTPFEFNLAIKAYTRREEMKWERTAWLAANIMNCWVSKGKKITPKKLLGKHVDLTMMTDREIEEYYRNKQKGIR